MSDAWKRMQAACPGAPAAAAGGHAAPAGLAGCAAALAAGCGPGKQAALGAQEGLDVPTMGLQLLLQLALGLQGRCARDGL